MPRVNLSVPFEEKDAAKALGAKWDSSIKDWYIPEGRDSSPFAKWLPKEKPSYNVKCQRFFVAVASQSCEKCSAEVKMVTFVLPRGWEEWKEADEDIPCQWQAETDFEAILNGVCRLNLAATTAAQKFNKNYKSVLRPGRSNAIFLNHCEQCETPQGEPSSGNRHIFNPETPEEARQITLHAFNQPIEAYSFYRDELMGHGGCNPFEYMKQASEV